MNYLLFYYLISRVIMVFVLLFGYTGTSRKTDDTLTIYTRAIFVSLIPILGESIFLQLLISALLSLL